MVLDLHKMRSVLQLDKERSSIYLLLILNNTYGSDSMCLKMFQLASVCFCYIHTLCCYTYRWDQVLECTNCCPVLVSAMTSKHLDTV